MLDCDVNSQSGWQGVSNTFLKCLSLDPCWINDYGDVSIHPPPEEKGRVPLLFQLQVLMQMVPEVIVQGIPSIERAIVNKNKDRCRLQLTLDSSSRLGKTTAGDLGMLPLIAQCCLS